MTDVDHLAELDDPDEGGGYRRGYQAGLDAGYARGYAAGLRDAGQPTANQPAAGELTDMRIVEEAADGR